MKSFTCFLLLLCITYSGSLLAQSCENGRYRDALFQVDKTTDVVFGNAPAITAVYVAENVTVPQDLLLDLYQPAGDTLSQRPLLVFAFGGGFLIGSKEDEDARALCDSFARKGYVTASINYRLNLNIADGSSAERAAWRAVQDWSAAIRYLKEHADSLRIDTNWVFAGGVSAGSISAMTLQYATDTQRPPSTFSQTIPPRPDLGCKDCEGNAYSHLSSVRALINCWGAISDTSLIDAQDSVPMASFHGDIDPVVPYGFGVPFTGLITMPPLYGSSLIHNRQNNLGLLNRLMTFPGEGHNVWGTVVNNNFVPGPTQHWVPILDEIEDFLWTFLEPSVGPVAGPGLSNVNATETYSVPQVAGLQYCWEITNGTIVSANPAASTIDVRWDIGGLGHVRCYPVSHLDAVGPYTELPVVVGIAGLPGAHGEPAQLSIHYGNAATWLMVDKLEAGPLTIELWDLQGKMVHGPEIMEVEAAFEMEIPLAGLKSGVYFLRLRRGRAMHSMKVLKF